MKLQIAKRLASTIVTVMAVLLVLNYYLQMNAAERNFETSAATTIEQMDVIIASNDAALESLTEGVKEEYIIRAQMVAYILENVGAETTADYQALAELLDVDEIHAFTTDGVIYAGSVPEYIGYSFYSGEQMEFFLPMLSDETLTLCQDVTPNTAEGKSMIYAAVWRSDGEGIVQIGLEPARLLEAQAQNELSYIFAAMPVSDGTNLYAVEASTGVVLGSTNENLVGQFDTVVREILDDDTQETLAQATSFYAEIDGVESICLFCLVGDVYIGVSQDKSVLYDEIWTSTLNSAIHICVASIILLGIIILIIDRLILTNINRLIEEMTQISGGNLDTKVELGASPEFTALSEHVNAMVASLLSMTVKLAQVLDKIDVKMSIYEYKDDMNRVLATANIGDLLDLFPSQLELILANRDSFHQTLARVKEFPVAGEEHVYDLGGRGERFLKIESLTDNEGTYGVIVDVTEEITELRKLSYERDYDILTNVYNRRAFLSQLETIAGLGNADRYSVVVVLDMDNLKIINDKHGHAAGDDAIRECVRIMKEIDTPNKIVARMGGDEFMVVLYGARTQAILKARIEELEAASKKLYIIRDDTRIPVELSAGYVFGAGDSIDYAVLEKQADEALYRAKRGGKASFVEY